MIWIIQNVSCYVCSSLVLTFTIGQDKILFLEKVDNDVKRLFHQDQGMAKWLGFLLLKT